jgi:L-ascorbate metabolism protein UlaG (beta-lactamase superfamily)
MAPIHTSPADAVMIHKIVKSPVSIGMHFGTFPLADDGQEDPVIDLKLALDKNGVPAKEFIVPDEGSAIMFRYAK